MEKRIIAVIWVITAMVFCSIVIIVEIAPIVKAPTTWYVDDVPGSGGSGDPPEDFTSIQDAINVAQPGDTVFVYNGTYFENVVVNETINLTGENKENTVINAGGNGIVVYVEVNWVNITGFTVTWSGSFFGEGGIILNNVKNCKVINNIISLNMWYGIYVESSMNNKVIDNNISSNNQHNIYLSSSSWNDIIGNNISSSNWGDGINLVSSSNNNIIGNSISYNFDGIEFSSSSNNNNITGNNISSNGGFGIALRSVSNNNFASNNFVHEGIFIGGSGLQHFNSHTILSNNIVNGEPLYFYKDSRGINIDGKPVGELIFANCTDVKVQNLRIDDTDVGIEVAFSTNIIITDNSFSNDNYGIYLQSSNGNSIIGNTASSNDEGIYLKSSSNNNIVRNKGSNNDDGITLESSSNHNIIRDNDFSGNSNGIYIVGSKDNNIAGNTFSNNGEGMRLFTSNSTITGNIVIFNSWGIRLYELSNHNRITGNIASSNAREGIYLQNSANGNIILGNDVIGNGYSGIRISSLSGSNDIIGNSVSYNGYTVNGAGIFIESSSNNLIYHNNIIENANQASDTTINGNQWDNGYPEGGNYWSDFDESGEGAYDDYKGPNQDDPTSGDGIVDNGTGAGGGINPYEIDGDSQDNYPLINSTENFILLYEGWNLISMPFILSDTSLGVVLTSIKGSYDAVQWYNISDNSDPWKHNSTKKPSYLNDLDRIDHTMGFWIHITEPGGVLFQYPGTEPMENQTIHIHPGWNLIGYPSLTTYNRTRGLNNLTFGTDIDAILTYNAGTHKWKKLGHSDYFDLGRGYWVHAKTKCEWEVPL